MRGIHYSTCCMEAYATWGDDEPTIESAYTVAETSGLPAVTVTGFIDSQEGFAEALRVALEAS